MKRITINGSPRQTTAPTVEHLSLELDPAPQTLLIERNKTALLRSEWALTPVEDDDTYEILRIAAGG